MDYQSAYSGPEIDERLRRAGTAYQKPQEGIPSTDLSEGVNESLEKADSAYQKPQEGIPSSDMAQGVQESLEKADDAYQKPQGGIPKSDMSSEVQTSLEKADSSYQKPQSGIPDTDLAQGVKTSLQKADSAYQKPQSGIPKSDLASGVQTSLGKADTAYQKPASGIAKTDLASGVQASLGKADTALQSQDLVPIEEVIPEQASSSNKLADKNFVNSSIATNTADYISDNGEPFTSVADLEAYSGPLTNNDYSFVVGTDAAGNTTYTRYKYNATTGQWAEEYVLNNSSFTADQWAAISSGITALLVQKLSSLPTEVVTYVAQTLTSAQKTQARTNLGAGTYSKPSSGIPKSDLASAVQTSLGKADTAYQKPSSGIPASDLESGVIPSDMVKYSSQSLTESQQMQARKNQGLYYEEEGTEEMTLTWDGDTTGRDMIDWHGDTLYKIADFPDADAIINIVATTIMQNGTPSSHTYNPPFGVEDMSDLLVSGKYLAGGSFAFAKDAVLEQGGQAHTGVYFLLVSSSRMTIYPSSCTFNVKSSSIHQIEGKYLPITKTLTSQSTDEETPSAKAVYDELATRYTKTELEAMAETWTFTMANGTTQTRKIIVLP